MVTQYRISRKNIFITTDRKIADQTTNGAWDSPAKERLAQYFKKYYVVLVKKYRINALVICFPHPLTPGDG